MRIDERFAAAKERHWSGNPEGAVLLYQSILAEEPGHVGALNNLGAMLKDQGRFATAMVCYRRALLASPDNADVLHNLARCHLHVEDYASAHHFATRAIKAGGDRPELWHTKALALHGQRKTSALAAYDKALELAPDAAQIQWDRSLLLLAIGDYEEGWRHHDARFRWYHKQVLDVPFPLWDGSDPAGKHILIVSDQGLGDAIMAWRFIPALATMGARVTLDLNAELLGLFPEMDGVTVRPLESPLPDIDFHLPLASLPGRMGCRLETMDGAPYLSAETIFRPESRSVGLVWNGTPNNPRDHERSVPLELLLPLCATPGVEFFSLQKGVRASDLVQLGAQTFIKDLSPFMPALADTARYLASIDLLVTVDTALAHLAGALGLETWLMVAASPDWRWGLTDQTTPWYRSVRIFRQKAPRTWDSVINDIQAELIVWSQGKENRHAAPSQFRSAAGF